MARKEDELGQNEAKQPKNKSRATAWIVVISIAVIGLFLFSYISGLARGFANS
ncbi:MAG TPA: hypothetical protein VN030_15165 [Cellvibrio sp.]|nr:hypothetical protein [Cellvibrio sp.]